MVYKGTVAHGQNDSNVVEYHLWTPSDRDAGEQQVQPPEVAPRHSNCSTTAAARTTKAGIGLQTMVTMFGSAISALLFSTSPGLQKQAIAAICALALAMLPGGAFAAGEEGPEGDRHPALLGTQPDRQSLAKPAGFTSLVLKQLADMGYTSVEASYKATDCSTGELEQFRAMSRLPA